MRILIISVLVVFFTQVVSAQKNNIKVVGSEISFKIKNGGLTVDGKFSVFSGTIIVNPSTISASVVNIRIESTTLSTGINARDNHLRKSDYFSVEKFPIISFKGSKVEKTASGYVVKGSLTIKETTKEIAIPFTYVDTTNERTFKGAVSLNRLTYGVGSNSWILSDDVVISLVMVTSIQ